MTSTYIARLGLSFVARDANKNKFFPTTDVLKVVEINTAEIKLFRKRIAQDCGVEPHHVVFFQKI